MEAGQATFAEWKQLIGRHAGFFHYDPETQAYCMITVPAPWRDWPGPTWQLLAAMLRHQRRQFSEAPPAPAPAHRIDSVTLLALQAFWLLAVFELLLAFRTNQNIE